MISQRSRIRKIGNSHGVILPADLLKEMGLNSSQDVIVSIYDGMIIISPPGPTLKELIASVPKGVFFSEVNTGKARGGEE